MYIKTVKLIVFEYTTAIYKFQYFIFNINHLVYVITLLNMYSRFSVNGTVHTKSIIRNTYVNRRCKSRIFRNRNLLAESRTFWKKFVLEASRNFAIRSWRYIKPPAGAARHSIWIRATVRESTRASS